MSLTTLVTRYYSRRSSCDDLVSTVNLYFCFRLSPAEVFMDLVLTYQAIAKAEKLAAVFGLNLQQLLEVAGDLKLSAKEFPQAIALYRLSKVC